MNLIDHLIRATLSNLHDHAPRLILSDAIEESGDAVLAGHVRLGPLVSKRVGGDGGGGGYGGDGDGGDGGYGGYGDYGYGKLSPITEIAEMEDGLYIITLPGGYYPHVVIGWIEINGLEMTVRGGRCIRRFGANQSLANLASKGPASDTQLLDPSECEICWRPSAGRVLACNPAAWKKECPRPKGSRKLVTTHERGD